LFFFGGFVVVAFALSSRLHVPLFPALAPSPLSRYLILHKPTLRFFLVFGLLRNFSSKKYSKIFSTKGDKLNAACRFSDFVVVFIYFGVSAASSSYFSSSFLFLYEA